MVRQYKIGTTATLAVQRGADKLSLPVELVRSPKLEREMKKYRDDDFEFTARDTTFIDKVQEQWSQEQPGGAGHRGQGGRLGGARRSASAT